MRPFRRLLALCGLIGLIAFQAGTAGAGEPPSPFPVKHGIALAGPFTRVHNFGLAQMDGQISEYVGMASWANAYSPAELKAMGFDFLRFAVNPAPLLANPPNVRPKLLGQLEAGFQPYLSHGMRVLFDMHFWSPEDPLYTNEAVTAGSPMVVAQYKQLLVQIAQRLAKYPQGQVALEILNEPNNKVCNVQGWLHTQTDLVNAVRRVAPKLPVVISGCNDLLPSTAAIDRTNTNVSDPYLIYTFHFYDPVLFTVQGQKIGNYAFLRGVPYPTNTGSEAQTLAATNAEIDATHNFISGMAPKSWAAREIHNYFINKIGPGYINKRMDFMIAWAHRNGIPASRVVLGEFAAVNNLPTNTPQQRAARAAWDNDVKAAADAHGIAWSYWFLPPNRGPIFQ
jgi:hypothetical protein